MSRRYLAAAVLPLIVLGWLNLIQPVAVLPAIGDSQTRIAEQGTEAPATEIVIDATGKVPATVVTASSAAPPVSCESLYPPSDAIASAEAWADTISNTASVLAQSTTAEHLLAAALLKHSPLRNTDPAESVALLTRAIDLGGSSPLLVWHAVNFCSIDDAPANCRLKQWERLLLDVDGGNSESWALVASNQFQRGDREQALFSLRRAGSAPTTSTFYTETAAAITRGLRAASNLSTYEQSLAGLASHLPDYQGITTMCREMSADGDWNEACLAYGRLVEQQSKTTLTILIGIAVQEIALDGAGHDREAAKVSQRREAYYQRMQLLVGADTARDFAMADNPALWAEYLGHIRAVGELEALALMAERMEAYFRLHPELDCVVSDIEPQADKRSMTTDSP